MPERNPIDEQTHLAAVQRLAQTPLPVDLRFRAGGKVGRNLYAHSAEFGQDGVDVGRVDAAALAEMIVEAVNSYLGHGVAYDDLRARLAAAEAGERRGERWWRRRRGRRLRDAEAEIRRLRAQLRRCMARDETRGDHDV